MTFNYDVPQIVATPGVLYQGRIGIHRVRLDAVKATGTAATDLVGLY